MRFLTAFVSGAMFAIGLAISGMVKPTKVIGFLDVTGHWDPTLAFVMGGALLVFVPAYRLVRRRAHPIAEPRFDVPTKTAIDPNLVTGAAIFGIGWGICGMCPAASIAALSAGSASAIAVTGGMAVGIVTMRYARDALVKQSTASVADF